MTSWKEFADAEPGLAARVRDLFGTQKHMTLATLRRDGSPRISGTEVAFADGELTMGMMSGSRKALDLQRDPRLALHSPTIDPPDEHHSTWPGDAKIAGSAVETSPADAEDHTFRIDITEVVMTKVAASEDCLVIESWHPGRGIEIKRR